jgi:hypothetical protein
MTDPIDRAEVERVLERKLGEATLGAAMARAVGDRAMLARWTQVENRFEAALEEVRALPPIDGGGGERLRRHEEDCPAHLSMIGARCACAAPPARHTTGEK